MHRAVELGLSPRKLAVQVYASRWYTSSMKKTKTKPGMGTPSAREILPPPGDCTLREWFAGLALMNATLMAGVPASKRVGIAMRCADELVKALKSSTVPSPESVRPPTHVELAKWDKTIKSVAEKNARRRADTIPQVPRAINVGHSMLPPPHKNSIVSRSALEDTRYSVLVKGDIDCDME